MSHLPRLTIRPPSRGGGHLQGYVGIPASSSASNGAKPRDPLLDDLPTLTNRPAASLNGIVEVHAASSTAYRVKWLRVELEKIETVPQPVHHGGKAGASGGKKFAEYIELIGEKPEELLGRAGVDIGTGIRGGLSANRKPSGGGRLRPLLGKKDDEFEDGWEILRSGSFPFQIEVPEGLPPTFSASSGASIKYQLVATLCFRGKKGLLKSNVKPSLVTDSVTITLVKSDMLTSWPIYSPVLMPVQSPTHSPLPWLASGTNQITLGETREAKLSLGPSSRVNCAGQVHMKVTRSSSVFGPGDLIQLRVELSWDGQHPVRLSRLEFLLRETIAYRHPSKVQCAANQRQLPRINTLAHDLADLSSHSGNALVSISAEEPLLLDLEVTVPDQHPVMTIRTAKYIEATYHIKVHAMIQGGEEIALEWPVLMNYCGQRESMRLMREIGWVDSLCDRPGLHKAMNAAELVIVDPVSATVARPHSPDLPPSAPLTPSPTRGLLTEAPPQSTVGVEHQRPEFAPSPSAAEEKRRLHESASRIRDENQARRARELEAEQEILESQHETLSVESHVPDSPATTVTVESIGAASFMSSLPTFHQAAIVQVPSATMVSHRDFVQSALAKSPEQRTLAEKDALEALLNGEFHTASARSAPNRSNTVISWSGSSLSTAIEASTTAPIQPEVTVMVPAQANTMDSIKSRQPPSSSTPVHSLLRSQTVLSHAEQEKKRLFDEARETARQRQAEAQAELDRQNALLLEIERQEVERAERERAQEEEERRAVELALRDRDEFERQQADRLRLAEEQWRREEEERRRLARAEFEERMRVAEERTAAELLALAERQRAREEERKDVLLRRRAEQDRIEEQRRRELAEREARRRSDMEQQHAYQIAQQRQQEEGDRRALEENKRRTFEAESPNKHTGDSNGLQSSSIPRYGGHEQHLSSRGGHDQVETAGYPASTGVIRNVSPSSDFPQPPARHFASATLTRNGSIASFAPSTSLHEADVNFYVNAIASTAQDARHLQEEKSAYVRKLRERAEAGIAAHHLSSRNGVDQGIYELPQGSAQLGGQNEVWHSSQSTANCQGDQSQDAIMGSIDGQEEGLPCYAQPSSQNATVAPVVHKDASASDEKAALTAYNAARAAVEAQAALSRSATAAGPPAAQSSPLGTILESHGRVEASSTRSPLAVSTARSSIQSQLTNHSDDSGSSHSELKRDPTVSAGKRPARRSTSGSTMKMTMAAGHPEVEARGSQVVGPRYHELSALQMQ